MYDKIGELTLSETETVMKALEIVENSLVQTAFVVDCDGVLIGILTNGDIRRFLLRGGSTSQPVSECMNREFQYVPISAPRETLLKMFDLGLICVPLIDEKGKIVNYASPSYFPPPKECEVLVRARAPVRLSFGGGGTDLTYYFIDHQGAVLSTTLALYAHAALIPSSSPHITIYSADIDKLEEYATLRELLACPDKGLLSSVVSVIRPSFGFELMVNSDFPVGSGLGGSSAVTTSVVAAFNELRLDRLSTYEIAEVAFQAERLCFGISGGWQDQYASAFGGFNLIEFGGKNRNLVHPIRLDPEISSELEECLLLCDTMIKHDSGKLHQGQKKEYFEEDRQAYFRDMVDISQKMHRYLIRGELREFGLCLDETWQLKRRMSSKITDDAIDKIYSEAIAAGALGGKLLGAGGGGFFVFFVLPRNRQAVIRKLKEMGCALRSVYFENKGVNSWRTRNS
jgi:D-glycero-alpha-D-manno-heptose-7-phosphate kinase